MPQKSAAPVKQLRDLELLITAHYPLIYLETIEDERATAILNYLADCTALPLFHWVDGKGLARHGDADSKIYGTVSPQGCLDHIIGVSSESLYHLKGVSHLFDEPPIIARFKQIYQSLSENRSAVVVTGPAIDFPPELEPLFTVLALQPPSDEETFAFIRDLLQSLRERIAFDVRLSQADVQVLIRNLRGLTLLEVKKLLTRLIAEEGGLSAANLHRILDAKKEVIERTGVLEFFPLEQGPTLIAGLTALKEWLTKRTAIFSNPDAAKQFGLKPPKGILLVGVQGCGKSLCAKAVAGAWRLPLLRLDPSSLYNKYVGETEKNLKKAISAAESLAPVVLWIDEIEKAFSQGGSDFDGGLSKRMFGSLLTWMQEKKNAVFVIATSNDITALPPELLRKGRFDEIFFVDLPDAAARAEILAIHLFNKGRDPAHFDLARLAAVSEGFSGAELEQAVVSALYSAFAVQHPLTTEMLATEIGATVPLSVTMAEKLNALRSWARTRTVAAN